MENPSDKAKQLCIVTVMFPVDSDDEAVRIKKEIAAAIVAIPESRIDFRLNSGHANPPTIH